MEAPRRSAHVVLPPDKVLTCVSVGDVTVRVGRKANTYLHFVGWLHHVAPPMHQRVFPQIHCLFLLGTKKFVGT